MDKRFREMAEHAYTTVPLYMRRDKGLEENTQWEEIPILTKEEILEDTDSFYSCSFMSLDREKQITQGRTSGSTGKCLQLYWYPRDYKASLLPVWFYRNVYYGIKPDDRMCYFYTTSNTGYDRKIEYEEEIMGNAKGFSKNNLSEERLSEIFGRMIEYKPKWLFLQPSMAIVLCDMAQKTGMRIPTLKYIELTGELLTQEVKKRIEGVFGCSTANHYGCNEMNTIAFECPYGNMHVAERNVYAEIVSEDLKEVYSRQAGLEEKEFISKEGRIIITSSVNHIMPFIRYDTGDYGRIIKGRKCRCGCSSDILEITKGRVHDYIKKEDGTKINAYIFVHAIEAMNRDYNNCIRQFSIVQKDYETLTVKLVVDEEVYDLGVSEEMLKEKFVHHIINKEMENMKYEFEFPKQLFNEKGKFLWFSRAF